MQSEVWMKPLVMIDPDVVTDNNVVDFRFATAFQFASRDTKKNGWSLANKFKKLLKKQELPEDVLEDGWINKNKAEWLAVTVFCGVLFDHCYDPNDEERTTQKYLDLFDQHLIRGVLWLFVASQSEVIDYLKFNLNEKQIAKFCGQFEKLIGDIRKLVETAKRSTETYEKAVSIKFWICEYQKRKLYLKLKDLNDGLSTWMGMKFVIEQLCLEARHFRRVNNEKCQFNGRLLFDDEWISDDEFIYHGEGCGVCKCTFRQEMTSIVNDAIQQISDGGSVVFDDEKIGESFCLSGLEDSFKDLIMYSIEYKIYPLDLFWCPTVDQILDYKECKGGYFKRHLVDVPCYSGSKNKHKKTVSFLENITDSYKKEWGKGNFHSNEDARLVGLWLWDHIHLMEKKGNETFSDIVRIMFKEHWYKRTEFGRKYGDDILNDSVSSKDVIDLHRKHYVLVLKSIECGRLLSLETAWKEYLFEEAGNNQ